MKEKASTSRSKSGGSYKSVEFVEEDSSEEEDEEEQGDFSLSLIFSVFLSLSILFLSSSSTCCKAQQSTDRREKRKGGGAGCSAGRRERE